MTSGNRPVPTPPDLRYEITLNFPGEPRLSEYQPSDFGVAVEYALDFAKKNKGVQVQVAVSIPVSPIHSHSYTLFTCEFPVLEPFMASNIRQRFGRLPY